MEFIKPGTHFDFVGKMKIAVGLSAAFVKWLQGKVLQPVSQGGQMLFRLIT